MTPQRRVATPGSLPTIGKVPIPELPPEGGVQRGIIAAGVLLAVGAGLAIYFVTMPEGADPPKPMTGSVFEKNSTTVKLGEAPPAPALPLAPPPAAPPPKPIDSSPPAPKPAGNWVFKGKAYDLINLRPVFDAKLTFLDDAGNARGEAATGDEGRYSITLEGLASGGYTVRVEHPDFRPKYLDEISGSPIREAAEEVRQALVTTVPRNKPWIGSAAGAVTRDFVMIPK